MRVDNPLSVFITVGYVPEHTVCTIPALPDVSFSVTHNRHYFSLIFVLHLNISSAHRMKDQRSSASPPRASAPASIQMISCSTFTHTVLQQCSGRSGIVVYQTCPLALRAGPSDALASESLSSPARPHRPCNDGAHITHRV